MIQSAIPRRSCKCVHTHTHTVFEKLFLRNHDFNQIEKIHNWRESQWWCRWWSWSTKLEKEWWRSLLIIMGSRRATFEEMGVFFGGDGEILKQEHRETFCPEFQQWWIIINITSNAILITTFNTIRKCEEKKHSFGPAFQQWWIIVKKMHSPWQHQVKLRKFTLAT